MRFKFLNEDNAGSAQPRVGIGAGDWVSRKSGKYRFISLKYAACK